MRSYVVSTLIMGAACISGCLAMTEVNGFKINQDSWNATQRDVPTRAEFDLKCPEDVKAAPKKKGESAAPSATTSASSGGK